MENQKFKKKLEQELQSLTASEQKKYSRVKSNTFFSNLKTSLEDGIAYYEKKKHLRSFRIDDPAVPKTPSRKRKTQ